MLTPGWTQDIPQLAAAIRAAREIDADDDVRFAAIRHNVQTALRRSHQGLSEAFFGPHVDI